MHKVDPIQIMLSDIFDKVFYKMASNVKECPECIGEGVIQRDEGDIDLAFVTCEECDGVGWVEAEIARPQNFDRDVGYLDTRRVECDECSGTGLLEDEE